MRILVTGGAGYIGSVTVRDLLDNGHEVLVLDSLERGHRKSVDSRAAFAEGSVGDVVVLDSLLPGCDAVMHLAGLIEVAESENDPARYFKGNVAAPLTMLEAMVRHGVDAIVFSSTAAVYGEPTVLPITEDAPTQPLNTYGESKLMFERVLDRFGVAHGLRSVRLRYFNVAGATPDGMLGEAHEPETHIVPKVLRAAMSAWPRFEVFGGDYPTPDGTCVRDYIHVLDLALAHRLALERLGAGGEGGIFNLGNGDGYSNLEVVRTCAEVTGSGIETVIGPRRAGDPAMLVASSDWARDELGWEPLIPDLRTIVEDAYRWHRAHPSGYDE